MYERFYQLRERPFALSPDPEYLYPSRVHREALSYLRYGIEGRAGFVVITGEIGSGKTTLLQTLLRGIDGEMAVARLLNTMLEPRELLEAILIDFGLEVAGKSKPVLLRDLAEFLIQQRKKGRRVLLVIDEAQNLGFPALEEVRMLSNFETEKSKLIQIVLVGQPNLRDKLALPELEQLRQRITVSYHLEPLDAEETAAYINHRLRRASAGAAVEFPREVTDLVHARSKGVPRMINVVCDAILLFGYGEERRYFDRAFAEDVMKELEASGVLPKSAAGSTDQAGRSADVPAVAAAPRPQTVAPAAAPAADRPPVSTTPAFTPPAPKAPVTSELVPPTGALEMRERELAQRERDLVEQQRVVAEEYRLLRSAKPAAVATREIGHAARANASSGTPWPPVTAGDTSRRVAAVKRPMPPRAVPRPQIAPFASSYRDLAARQRTGFWAWLKRVLFGVGEPALGNRVGARH